MGLINDKTIQDFTEKKFPEYTEEEKAVLKETYSPEQIAALEAGEAAINPKDLTLQGRIRVDPYRLPYIDDFRNIEPIIDRRPRTKPPADPNARFMDVEEFAIDLAKWADEKMAEIEAAEAKRLEDFAPDAYKSLPQDKWPAEVLEEAEVNYSSYVDAKNDRKARILEDGPDEKERELASKLSDKDVLEYLLERSSMTDGGDKGAQSSLAPALPNKVPGVAGLYKNAIDPADEGLDNEGLYQDLKHQTGLSVREIMSITTKTLVHRSVHNQTRLGKIRSSSVMVIAGNKNGWLGLGMAKSVEQAIATEKAKTLAIRNMRPVPRYENRTIYGNVEAKVGATVVRLYSRPPGKEAGGG
jgi:small subunit ribosomal protein S5